MKLQTRVWLVASLMIALIIAADFSVSRALTEGSIRAELERDARTIRGTLMATRRVYHRQFIDSGLPVNERTIGFLPAHAMSRIAADFPNWSDSGLSFNNVSDRPRNPANLADEDELAAMQWFRANPERTERLTEIHRADGSFYHYTAPIWIEPYCLQCHGERSAAPPSVAADYDSAYGYQVGDLRGVMSIKLPTAALRDRAQAEWWQGFSVRLAGYVLLLLALGLLMQRFVTRRLLALQDSAGRLAGGDYAARCTVGGGDEIGDLGQSFNAMAGAVESSTRELERHRHHLEDMLAERTRDLVAANADLARARDAAEAGSLAKSAFLANMSHEIRTPMNAITGMAYLMRRDDGLPPKQAERLEKIDAAARHLLGIINDILDLSRIEAGKLVLEDAPLSPAALLHNVASMLSEVAQGKGLRLLVVAAPMPPGLHGDPTRLTQALVNYAGNAIKFAESGDIVLRLSLVAETPNSATVRFAVEDHGPGIAPEMQPRLFAAFEQVDGSMTRRHGGTGLGLAITRRLAGLMGGAAGVDSMPGEGATFWFTAVLRKDEAPAPPPPSVEHAIDAVLAERHCGRRILLAEDEPINREVALGLLEEAGLAVDVAEDGVVAVERARATRYDLILMDLQMPRMGGLEAARRIRELANGADVPILAMTANTYVEDRQRCAEAGMDDFVGKPVVPERLYAVLLKWLDRGRAGAVGPDA
ncbi:MAG: DUF3365 domain-containing protein [Rhodocyclaceae bacterium]|nr:DUF3365 domain-containing protein [Rhodocyclaceae bacterium]